MAEPTQPVERMVVCYFIVSDDIERSRRFYTEVLGGRVVFGPEPTNIALANSFIVINGGGDPTDDKPTVTLETPRDLNHVSSIRRELGRGLGISLLLDARPDQPGFSITCAQSD